MPSPPEFGDALGAVGGVEVPGEFKAQHAPEPNSHVGIGGEIEVDLKCVGRNSEPRLDRGGRFRIEHGIGGFPHDIGQENLLGETKYKQSDAGRKLVKRMFAATQLAGDRLVPDNGSGDELRKERHKTGEVEKRAYWRRFASVDVDGVAHTLENIEGNPHRQRDLKHRQGVSSAPLDDLVKIRLKKHEVLEEAQQAQARHHGRHHGNAPSEGSGLRAGDDVPAGVIERGGKEHEQHKPGIPPTVKYIAGAEEEKIPFARQEVVQGEHGGKEVEHKYV